jgi:8-hydroxy-5-deazaflavin:NADPH oxidoreductase
VAAGAEYVQALTGYGVATLGLRARLEPASEFIAADTPLILAVPYAAALEVAAARPDWRGRILIDATNPLAPGLTGLSVMGTTG